MIAVISHVDVEIEVKVIRIWNLDTVCKWNHVRLNANWNGSACEYCWMLENVADHKTGMNRLAAIRWPPGDASEWRVLGDVAVRCVLGELRVISVRIGLIVRNLLFRIEWTFQHVGTKDHFAVWLRCKWNWRRV